MQKIKTTRWPTRNPFGDNLIYKMRIVGGHTFQIPMGATGMAYPSVAGVQFNNGAAITASYGEPPGLSALANAFTNYKIAGVKQKLTFWPLSAPGDPPLVGFTEASGDSIFSGGVAAPQIIWQPEQRWVKYRTLNFANQGGKPTSLSVYYSVNKVYGPDMITKGSASFVGLTQLSAPWFAAGPPLGPYFRQGIMTLSGVAAPAPINVVVKIETTVYIKFFGKRDILT